MAGSWDALRDLVVHARLRPTLAADGLDSLADVLLMATSHTSPRGARSADPPPDPEGEAEARRRRALVELACAGDTQAFGLLYDHYLPGIFRFVSYRVASRQVAEDITSATFERALRAVPRFEWQGKDFGAWLTTIARNLVADHYKSARQRHELTTEEVPEGEAEASPEDLVVTAFANGALMDAVAALPPEQRDCLLMRFVQQMTIAQTAQALGRTEGAIKQLQLRAVRRLSRDASLESLR